MPATSNKKRRSSGLEHDAGAGVSRISGVTSGPITPDPNATLAGAKTTQAPPDEARRRRIAYFMLFRLGMLTVFTVLAVFIAASESSPGDLTTGFVWGTLVVGFTLTIVFARQLPRVEDLTRFAWLQTTTDIVLAAVVVQMTGGADSGFQWLFLIAVLGGATMGDTRTTWAAAGACVLILITLGMLEWTRVVEPMVLGEPVLGLPPTQLWLAIGRTTAGILGVTFLSSYLGRQLSSSALQVDELRVLNENIVRSLSSGLLTVDTAGRVLYYNPAAEGLLRLSPEAIGHPVEGILPGLTQTLADQGAERAELPVEVPQVGPMHLGLSRMPLVDASGERIGDLINFTDLTRLQELTEQVRRNERLAALGGLAASVAHEIRNPLTAIAGSAELLGATPGLDDQDQRLLKVIQRESGRLGDLITDLLAFTRPKKPNRVKLSVASTVRDTREAFCADPLNKNIELQVRVDEDVPVYADPAQLSQVIWNLVRNAAEAMERKGWIQIRISREMDLCRVDITDDGPGIDPEKRDRIFDPFFTTKEHGTGFGLAIVHRVVEDNRGTIDVESTVGHGTTFTLRFVAADTDQAEISGVFSV